MTKDLQHQLVNVPIELLALRQWVGWKLQYQPEKERYTKPPFSPHSGQYAQTDNPSTWGGIQDVLDAQFDYDLDGAGFVFTEQDPLSGVDLDGCVNDEGEIEPWAQEIINEFDCYTEFSPSGKGIHIITKGRVPSGLKRGGIEVYSSGRYFTVTGNRVPGTPEEINERQPQLDALYKRLGGEKKEPAPAPPPVATSSSLDDLQLLELARNAANGQKFARLMDGDAGDYSSQSEADLALCAMLAFYTQRDAAQMDRLFRQSGLLREKWDKVHSRNAGGASTYGEMTIAKAIELTSEVYEPAAAGTIIHKGQIIAGTIIPTAELASELFSNAQRVPQLPESVQIPPQRASEASKWLEDYIEFSRYESPGAYSHYHEACGIWILSTLAGRRIAYKPNVTTIIWPNLFIALAGVSTLWRKSTTTNVARYTLSRVGGGQHFIYPFVSSAENLIRVMRPPREIRNWPEYSVDEQIEKEAEFRWAHVRGLYWDELGVRIRSILNRRGPYAAMYQLLLQAGRGEPVGQQTIDRGLESAPDAYLTLLGNMTPANLRQMDSAGEMWQDGFLSRLNFICPPVDARPINAKWQNIEHIPNEVLKPIQDWHARLPQPQVSITERLDSEGEGTGDYTPSVDIPEPLFLSLAPEAEDAFYAYDDALREIIWERSQQEEFYIAPSYASLPTSGLRIAMLLASLEGGNRIELKHWARAQQITERWRESLHNLIDQVDEPQPDPAEQKIDKVYRAIQEEWRKTDDHRITFSHVVRRFRTLPGQEILSLLMTLKIRRLVNLRTEVAANNKETTIITPPEFEE